MHLFFDAASIELFADDGKTALTDIFFPNEDFNNFTNYTDGGKIYVASLQVWDLKSIWK